MSDTTPLTDVDTELEAITKELADSVDIARYRVMKGEIGPAQGFSIAMDARAESKERFKALIGTIAEQIKRDAEIQLVESACNMLQTDEPIIDEIWFDYDFGDGEITPMRQDTLLAHLKATTPGAASENNEANGQRLKDYMEKKQ